MGYLTYYKLELSVANKDNHKACSHYEQWIEGASYCHICGVSTEPMDGAQLWAKLKVVAYSLDEGIHSVIEYMDSGENMKWYDHEKDCRKLSALMPGVLFTLNGEGEDAGDVWVKYFLDGKMQTSKVEVILDEFDATKLE